MAKVHVVTVCDYETTIVVGVFDEDHKAEAEKKAELVGGRVGEGIELNTFNHDEPPTGMSFFYVTLYKNGERDVRPSNLLADGYHDCLSILNDEISPPGRLHKTGYQLRKRGHRINWQIFAKLYAPNEETAVKIVDDIRIKLLAGELPEEGPIPTP